MHLHWLIWFDFLLLIGNYVIFPKVTHRILTVRKSVHSRISWRGSHLSSAKFPKPVCFIFSFPFKGNTIKVDYNDTILILLCEVLDKTLNCFNLFICKIWIMINHIKIINFKIYLIYFITYKIIFRSHSPPIICLNSCQIQLEIPSHLFLIEKLINFNLCSSYILGVWGYPPDCDQSTIGHTLKKFYSFSFTSSVLRPSIRHKGTWIPSPSMLECCLVWYYLGNQNFYELMSASV